MNPNVETAKCDSSDSSSSKESGAASPPTPRRLYKKHKSGDVLNRAARQLIINAYVQVRQEPPAKPGQPGLTVEESCMKGQRLIVTHIGSDEGFVDGCLDVFRGQKTGDYHEEMDGARFNKWFDGVLDTLPTGSVIVMDNASYHSRRLEALSTTSSRKDDIRQWLTSKKISWDPKMVKKQLLDIVALVKPQHLKYRVDTAAETAGCTVVRLPPYHCEFNPIELIWAQIKNGVGARNTTFKIADVGRFLNEEVDKVTTENWINAVRHVTDIEATFRRGGATSAHIQPIVIQLDGEDTPSESDLSGVEPLDEA
ncbi:uncharacterized protein ISCGN_010756 [Ixodes scapularis]